MSQHHIMGGFGFANHQASADHPRLKEAFHLSDRSFICDAVKKLGFPAEVNQFPLNCFWADCKAPFIGEFGVFVTSFGEKYADATAIAVNDSQTTRFVAARSAARILVLHPNKKANLYFVGFNKDMKPDYGWFSAYDKGDPNVKFAVVEKRPIKDDTLCCKEEVQTEQRDTYYVQAIDRATLQGMTALVKNLKGEDRVANVTCIHAAGKTPKHSWNPEKPADGSVHEGLIALTKEQYAVYSKKFRCGDDNPIAWTMPRDAIETSKFKQRMLTVMMSFKATEADWKAVAHGLAKYTVDSTELDGTGDAVDVPAVFDGLRVTPHGIRVLVKEGFVMRTVTNNIAAMSSHVYDVRTDVPLERLGWKGARRRDVPADRPAVKGKYDSMLVKVVPDVRSAVLDEDVLEYVANLFGLEMLKSHEEDMRTNRMSLCTGVVFRQKKGNYPRRENGEGGYLVKDVFCPNLKMFLLLLRPKESPREPPVDVPPNNNFPDTLEAADGGDHGNPQF
jgi:hypothetical protein